MKAGILDNWIDVSEEIELKRFGSGHIHQTFLVKIRNKSSYILQKLNTSIFGLPEVISKNIELASDFLSKKDPEYRFPGAELTRSGEPLLIENGEHWRLSRFIENSYSPDVLESPQQAFEAAKAFGKLSRLLHGIPMDGFQETIPDFHNLHFRYFQFEQAMVNTSTQRLKKAEGLVEFYKDQKTLVDVFDKINSDNLLPPRIQHHDTKINNVLFDNKTHKALAVCDLDTLMPGYFISDLGDMIRTYTSAENEDSTRWNEVKIRTPFLEALLQGYLSEMENVLTTDERYYLSYAGEFMIYMQGLRFLSDYLNGDIYYPVKYEQHNYDRAKNQMILLQNYQEGYSRNFFEEILQKKD